MSFLGGLFSSAKAPPVYTLKGMGTADTNAQNDISALPGAVAATGYNPASTVQQGQQVSGSVQQDPGYASAALTAGFDPQRQLYDQMMQQQQQQNLATQASQGVANTPYGAGLTNQGNQNFNLAWNNNQLNRMGQGAQTAEGLQGSYQAGMGEGANLEQAGGQFAEGLNQLGTQDELAYLGAGTNASNAATNAQSVNNQASQAFWNGIGNLAGAAAGYFLPGSGSLFSNSSSGAPVGEGGLY